MLNTFNQIARVPLLQNPTPLMTLTNLSTQYGHNCFIKRDDLNGVGVGGNKVRKLEYLLKDAIEQQAQAVITGGGIQSNHAAATALCANRLGLKTHLALVESVPISSPHYSSGANLVLDQLANADVKTFPAGSKTNDCISAFAQQITTETGIKPYEICMGGSNAIGALGYVRAALELAEQFKAMEITPKSIVHASGSAGTQAGLIVGFKLAGCDIDVLACSVLHPKSTLSVMVLNLCHEIADLLQMPHIDWSQQILINDNYIGEGYGLASASTWESIQTAITLDSVVLDPCYSGKAFNYYLDLVKAKATELGNQSIFLHTGGITGLFAYAEEMPK